MTDESVLALEAGPEVVAPAETPEPSEVVEPEETPEPAEKSESAKRRERDKAAKQRLAEERDAALAEAEQARARLARMKDAAQADEAPKEADFSDPLEYAAAKGAWIAHSKLVGREVSAAEEAEKVAKTRVQDVTAQEEAHIAREWQGQVADARARYADFDAVALNPEVKLSQSVARMVATSETGADLAYHLGKNPAIAAELSELAARNPVEAARRIGRIEAGLSLPKPRTETNAPAPISPVKGQAAASRDPSKMSFAEFKAYREGGGKVGKM
jgi:hypothetical protein